MEHQQAALRKAIAAMSAFTDPEGNMPLDTGEFRDLKEALSDCEAALLTMPDDALNKPAACLGANCGTADGISHLLNGIVEAAESLGWAPAPGASSNEPAHSKCCGNCQGHAEVEKVERQLDAAMLKRCEETIVVLNQRLREMDSVIIALVQAAGGEVTVDAALAETCIGRAVVADVSADGSTFTFRAVPVQQGVVQ